MALKQFAVAHYTIDTGHLRTSKRREASRVELADMAPLLAPGVHPLPRIAGYRVSTAVSGSTLVASVNAMSVSRDLPLVTIYVCVDRASINEVFHTVGISAVLPEPACIVKINPSLALDRYSAGWLGSFEKCLAWAWIEGVQPKPELPASPEPLEAHYSSIVNARWRADVQALYHSSHRLADAMSMGCSDRSCTESVRAALAAELIGLGSPQKEVLKKLMPFSQEAFEAQSWRLPDGGFPTVDDWVDLLRESVGWSAYMCAVRICTVADLLRVSYRRSHPYLRLVQG